MSYRDIARITIETTSPLHIGSGANDDILDAPVLTDANGLPTIPGTSIAGILRHAWLGDIEKVFGKVESEGRTRASRISVSWGLLHDSKNRPVAYRASRTRLEDPLLKAAREMTVRSHVRIGHTGTAEDGGLFDCSVVPAGHRFTFELELRYKESEKHEFREVLSELIGIIGSQGTRIGGRTRSGLGAFRIVSVRRRCFNLVEAGDFEAFVRLDGGLDKIDLDETVLPSVSVPDATPYGETVLINGSPRGFWMVGGGEPIECDKKNVAGEEKAADIVAWREPRVEWKQNEAVFDFTALVPVVPGSSIKGALRHRTQFHLNALRGVYADNLSDKEAIEEHGASVSNDLAELFGHAARENSGSEAAVRGRVIVDDVEIESIKNPFYQEHVTIDRFTGGALDGMLFSEAPLWKGEWKIKIHLVDTDSVSGDVKTAFSRALSDLARGRLALGGGTGRGHGRFEGRISWTGGEPWPNRYETE